MHTHDFILDIPRSSKASCSCGLAMRVATGDEARWIQMTNDYTGVFVGSTGYLIVPTEFSLWSDDAVKA